MQNSYIKQAMPILRIGTFYLSFTFYLLYVNVIYVNVCFFMFHFFEDKIGHIMSYIVVF